MQTIGGNGHHPGADRAERVEPTRIPPSLDEPEAERFPLVIVEWHDAWFDVDLESVDRRRPSYLVRTIGFLLSDGPVISVAQELLPDGEGFRAVTHVPAPLVQRILELDRAAEPDLF
jgi:hypothetical protein